MRHSHKVAVVGATTAALLGAGIAFAAWTSNGTGTGTATAGTAATLTVSGSDATGLFPTGSKTITVTVTNNNDYKVRLDTISSGAITVDAGHGGCTAANGFVTAASGTYGAAADDIAAHASVPRVLSVNMGADAADACQGAVFTVTYTATAHSVA